MSRSWRTKDPHN